VDKAPKASNEKLDQVLKAHLSIVPDTRDLKFFNDAYMAKHKDCARRTQAGLKVRVLLDPASKAQSEKDLAATVEKADMKEASEGLEILREWESEKRVVEEYKSKASGKWPEASVFK
jgi:peptide alpha-N-acetyltransferase